MHSHVTDVFQGKNEFCHGENLGGKAVGENRTAINRGERI